MMRFESFSALVDHIVSHGYPEERASKMAIEVGDMPVVADGQLVLLENGVEVGLIPWPVDIFGDPPL